jgi:DNA-binding response OmpR family regulator
VRKKITIIEDNKPIANMYKFKLENDGYEVDVAHTGPDGFELVKRKRPHLVLLDLRLPHMNGEEVLRKIRATDWGEYLRVLIIDNVALHHNKHKLKDSDFDKYIIKVGHTPQEILDLVKHMLEPCSTSSKQTAN